MQEDGCTSYYLLLNGCADFIDMMDYKQIVGAIKVPILFYLVLSIHARDA